jgi:predicted PurR-regulated permease PerM
MEPAVPLDTGPAARRTRRLGAPTPRVALTIAAAVAFGVVIVLAAGAVKPFVLGVLLVYLLSPAVERLAALRVPRAIAVLLVFLASIIVIAVASTIALAPLIREARLFVEDLPDIVATVRDSVTDFYQGLNVSPEVRELIDNLVHNAGTGLGGIDLGSIVSPLVSSIVGILSTVTAYAILPAWLFFLLKDRARLGARLEASLPATWRDDVLAAFAIANRVFGNWVRGQLILGASVGVLSYIGLMALSTWVDPVFGRYAVLLAIIAGLMELIPFIGPIIAAIPAVLVGLTAGFGGFAAAFFLYLGIQQLENNVLVPKIQGDAVELHPSAVMFALVVGASIGGILGAIVSLPIAAASRDLFRYAFHRVGDPPATVEESLAHVSPRLIAGSRRSAPEDAVPPAVPPAGTAPPAAGAPGGPDPAPDAQSAP